MSEEISKKTDNLGRWKPGQSGNLKGRPKAGESYTDILYKMLNKRSIKGDVSSPKLKEQLLKKLVDLALAGDISAIKYCIDRVDGKAVSKQIMELGEETLESLSLQVNVVKKDIKK